jgi:GNAT superfamily N-acetyltransferase
MVDSDGETRRADLKDAPALLDIMAGALAVEAGAGAIVHGFPDREREIAWLEYLIGDEAGQAIVADVRGEPAAFGITAHRGGVCWLALLFTAPAAQGRGIGRRILAQLWPADSGPRATLVDGSSRVAMAIYLQHGLVPQSCVLAFEGATAPARGAVGVVLEQGEEPERIDALDAQVFGGARRNDHAFWSSHGFALRQLRGAAGEWLGYARWSPAGRLGPMALVGDGDWPGAVSAVVGEMHAAGVAGVRMMIPSQNRSALRWALESGWTYKGMEVALATQSIGDWSRCLFHRAALP